jgi:hypothetical protein
LLEFWIKLRTNRQIASQAAGDGYHFTFANGVKATLYRMASPKMRRMKVLVEDFIYESVENLSEGATFSENQCVVEAHVKRRRFYLICQPYSNTREVLAFLEKHRSIKKQVCMVVFKRKVYPIGSFEGQVFIKAVEKNVDPGIIALLTPHPEADA